MESVFSATIGAAGGSEAAAATELWLATEDGYPELLATLPPAAARWAQAQGYAAQRHRLLLLPAGDGGIAAATWGLGSLPHPDQLSPWDAAPLPERLPAGGTYRLATALGAGAATQFALGWLLGGYRFAHPRSTGAAKAGSVLIAPALADQRYAQAAAQAMGLARDLINTPPNQLGPQELEAAARKLAARYGGETLVVSGEELARDYPLVCAVGAASARAARLIDCRWPRAHAPRVTLVGKGVCFDSGGLDLKPSAAMLLMKKDMGGAACVLGLAQLLLQLAAPIELRVLIPAVENSVGGRADRPGDVWR
jgi:leucyl aminopeptidase